MRILLILGPFLLAIGGLVYLQTGMFEAQGSSNWTAEQSEVSEPAIPLTNVTDVIARLPQEEPVAVAAPQAAQVAVASPENDEMQALTSSVLQGLGVEVASAPIATPLTGPESELRALTTGVLAGLGVQVENTATTPLTGPENELRTLTSAVLAGLAGQDNDTPSTGLVTDQSLATLITQAIQQGRTDSQIDAMVNAASQAGDIEVPAAYFTSEGRVDTGSLIAELKRGANGDSATATPNDQLVGGPGVEVRVVQEAGETVQHNFYTVQKGDSLGAISQLYYGDAALYTKIFEANRRLLSSPNRIKAGQRLTIPAFSAG